MTKKMLILKLVFTVLFTVLCSIGILSVFNIIDSNTDEMVQGGSYMVMPFIVAAFVIALSSLWGKGEKGK